MNLLDLIEANAKKFPEKKAIIYHDQEITYRELNQTASQIANALINFGIEKNDRIGLVLPKIPELIISFLAIWKAHAIAVPINFHLLNKDLSVIISHISPRFLFVHKQYLERMQEFIKPNDEIRIIVVGENAEQSDYSWEQIIRYTSADFPTSPTKEDDIVYLNYTSGSTGNSKGAVTTHGNIYWNTFAAVETLGLTSDDIHLCMFAPYAHPHEIFSRAFYLGGTVVLLDKIYPKSIAESITSHGITCMMGLVPMYEHLIEIIDRKRFDLCSLRIPESGGMYTSHDLVERFKKKIGVPIIPVWGSTETTGIAIANQPGEDILPGTVGKPCTSYEVRIVDELGKDLPAGQVGEMIFKGPAVVRGYYKDSTNTQKTFKNGWYYSGDMGRKDEKNNFYFIERKSSMMKIAGLKVYPLEIELALMEHPGIKEVAVVSAEDKLRGEIPRAIVVPNNKINITEKDIIEFCKCRLANYKIPKIVEIRDFLPKMESGKLNKKGL